MFYSASDAACDSRDTLSKQPRGIEVTRKHLVRVLSEGDCVIAPLNEPT